MNTTKLLESNTANLIELFVDASQYTFFVKGMYHDELGEQHELKMQLHSGILSDSVTIALPVTGKRGIVMCKYVLKDDALAFNQVFFLEKKGDVPFLIHNTGETEITISFGGSSHPWKVRPNESKRILPL